MREQDVISRGNPFVAAAELKTHHNFKFFRGTTDNVYARREVWNKSITVAGRDYIIHSFKGSTTLNTNFNFHDFGTGVGAESTADTGMGTAVSELRVEGTADSTGNTFTSVATMSFSSNYAITEHGIFSQAAKPGGILLDRTVFAAVNVTSDDSIQATFTLTMAAGG